MASGWSCQSLLSFYCLYLSMAVAVAVEVEVRLNNNSSLLCQPLSSDSPPVGETVIWQINGVSRLAAELSKNELHDDDRIRCVVVWSDTENQRVNWSPIVISKIRSDDIILEKEGVTIVSARPNELLDLPPTIVIRQQSFRYSDITSVVGNIVTFCNATDSEGITGLLENLSGKANASTVLKNEKAEFVIRNFSLQLNLRNPIYNFSAGQLYVHINIFIGQYGGGSRDFLRSCYKVIEEKVVPSDTSTSPDTSTTPETSTSPDTSTTPETSTSPDTSTTPSQESSTQVNMSSTVSRTSSSPTIIQDILYFSLASFGGCVLGCCVLGGVVALCHCRKNKRKSKPTIHDDCNSLPNVDQVSPQPGHHQTEDQGNIAQASNVGSNEQSEQVRLRYINIRPLPHANFLRGEHGEGGYHQDPLPPLGHFAHCSTPNSSATQLGEQLFPPGAAHSPMVEHLTSVSFTGFPATTSLQAAPSARFGGDSMQPSDESVMRHTEATPLNTDHAAQINYVWTTPDWVHPPGPCIVNPQELLPYNNRSLYVYLSRQQQEHNALSRQQQEHNALSRQQQEHNATLV